VRRTSSTPSTGSEGGDDLLDELLGSRRPGGHPDHPAQVVGQLIGGVDRKTAGSPASGQLLQRPVFDELAEPITTIASQRGAISMSADCRLVVAKHRSLRPGVHTSGNARR
jgi:fermentation-respiration switch protein FrsA (DUF1100 family)